MLSDLQTARARYIRTILAHHDHNQTDLGRLLGVTQQAAGRKLKGQRRFLDDELLLIADTYGIDPANMLRPPPLEGVLGPVFSAKPESAWTYGTPGQDTFPSAFGSLTVAA